MPMLRRPDDHHLYVRGRAPCAIAIANPDQNRHLMTVAAALSRQPFLLVSTYPAAEACFNKIKIKLKINGLSKQPRTAREP
jgi:hypothetical protein